MRRRSQPMLASAVLSLVSACGSRVPASPVGVTRIASSARISSACGTVPFEHGCVRALSTRPGAICAQSGTREYCWGPGASVSGVTDASTASTCQTPASGGALVECHMQFGGSFRLPLAPEIGLTSADDVNELVSGTEHACVLAHGNVICFGATWSSLRGERNPDRRFDEPNRVELDGVTHIVALDRTTCALARGDVYCWGDALYFPPGALDRAPTKFVAAAFPAGDFGCFLGADGTMFCGVNGDYVRAPGLVSAKQIAAIGQDEVCARLDGGRVSCIVRGGEVRARPSLEPAKLLIDSLPCALLEGGRVHCDAWQYEGEDFPAMSADGLGVVQGIGAVDLGGRPAACAVTERGEVACWGITGFDWVYGNMGRRGDDWQLVNHDERQPVRVPDLKDVVQITRRGGCVRTRDGKVATLAVSTRPKHLQEVRLGARTVKGADHVEQLDEECIARRGDGSAFSIVTDWPAFAGPTAVGPARLEAFVPPAAGDPRARELGSRFRLGKHSGYECALRSDAGIACYTLNAGQTKAIGPEFDPVRRSTLPVRVIPPM